MSESHTAPSLVTGIPSAKLGTWLFLASEVMLFATLFTTYIVLRLGSPSWPRGQEVLNVPLAMFNTLVVTMVMAYAKILERDLAGFRKYMGFTLALGFIFLIIKGFEYGAKFQHGIVPSTSIFYGVYFTMTGLHALHVIGGIVLNAILARHRWTEGDQPGFTVRVECAGLYWPFVDIVWIFLFPALYLL